MTMRQFALAIALTMITTLINVGCGPENRFVQAIELMFSPETEETALVIDATVVDTDTDATTTPVPTLSTTGENSNQMLSVEDPNPTQENN